MTDTSPLQVKRVNKRPLSLQAIITILSIIALAGTIGAIVYLVGPSCFDKNRDVQYVLQLTPPAPQEFWEGEGKVERISAVGEIEKHTGGEPYEFSKIVVHLESGAIWELVGEFTSVDIHRFEDLAFEYPDRECGE